MEFGDRKIFAVQFELDSDHVDSWLFGRFGYWINGSPVGDYDLGTSLREVFLNLKWIEHDRGNRWGNGLCNRPFEEVFLLLDTALYGDSVVPSNVSLPESPARFDIRPAVDVFDAWKVYLFACRDSEFLIYRHWVRGQKIEVFEIRSGMFDAIIKKAYEHLEQLLLSHP